jgi:hypothetical protein
VFSAKSYRRSVCGFGGNDGYIAGSVLLLKIICHFRALGFFFCLIFARCCCEVVGSAFISMLIGFSQRCVCLVAHVMVEVNML